MSAIKKSELILSVFFLTMILLFVGSCSSFLSGTVEDMMKEIGIDELPTAEDYPDDDAVYLFIKYKTVLDVEDDLVLKETVHKAMMLFKNIEAYSDVTLKFNSYDEIFQLEARIISPNGEITNLTEKDIYYLNDYDNDGTFVSDIKTIKISYPNVQKGSIIEYKYMTKSSGEKFVSNRWYIQRTLPIIYNQYVLQTLSELQYFAKMAGVDLNWNAKPYNYYYDQKPVYKNTSPNYTHTEWVIRDIPAFDPQPKMPPIRNYISYIQFAPKYWSEGWDAISEMYYTYFKEVLEPCPEVKNKVENIKNDVEDEDSRIAEAFEYVRNMRYVAIELGFGGLIPTKPAEVIRRGYGDCKDKSALLIAMLREMGIKAYPVLVLTSNEGKIDTSFPLMDFNHMIVKVRTSDDKTIWLDPTSEFAPFGVLPWQCAGIDVLVIKEDGKSYIEETPFQKYKDNLQHKDITLNINSINDAEFQIDFTFKGMENIFYRYLLEEKTDEDKEKLFRSFLIDDFDDAKIVDFYHDKVDSLSHEFHMGFTVEVANALQNLEELYILTYDPLDTFSNTSWLSEDERKFPIYYNYPYLETENISININSDILKVKTVPTNFGMNVTDYKFTKEYELSEDNKIYSSEYYAVKTQFIPAIRYSEIQDFYSVVKNQHSKKIILTHK